VTPAVVCRVRMPSHPGLLSRCSLHLSSQGNRETDLSQGTPAVAVFSPPTVKVSSTPDAVIVMRLLGRLDDLAGTNGHLVQRPVSRSDRDLTDLHDDVQAFVVGCLAEDRVLAIQMRDGCRTHEEL